MRVLITGAAGFVGRALCRELSTSGFSVRAAVRTAAPPMSRIEQTVIGNISPGTDWAAALSGIDTVVHLAARVHVMRDRSRDPLSAFRLVNVTATERLAVTAASLGIRRLLFVSSIKVNGERTSPGRPYSENDRPEPADAYGQSKWEAEQMLQRVASDTGLEVVILRPPLIYGPGVKANFLNLMNLIARRIPLPLGAIANRRSLLYLGNLTDAIRACLSDARAANRTFLVSDGEDLSTPELIQRLAHALNRPARLLSLPPGLLARGAQVAGQTAAFERLTGSLTVDNSLIRHLLDWNPPYSVQQGLEETAQWFSTRNKRFPTR